MRYLPAKKLLFIHIPKTGGVSVENAINNNYDGKKKHITRWKGGRHIFKESLLATGKIDNKQLTTFTFVRHPVKWYESTWRFLKKGSRNFMVKYPWHPHKVFVKLWDDDYSKWIERVLEEQPAIVTRLYELYCGPEGCESANFIGRTETLEKDFSEVWGEDIKMPHKNKSKIPPVEISTDLIHQIEKMEQVAIRRFYGEKTINYRWAKDWQKD